MVNFFDWNIQPFQESLVSVRVVGFESTMPLFHRGVVQSDFPKQLNPLVFIHRFTTHGMTPYFRKLLARPMTADAYSEV
jgi:hypothetical protein